MAIRLQHEDGDLPDQHDINVTPFIDVMLVLLIVFMVAAPLATVSIAVDLPASSAARQPPPVEPVQVVVHADGQWEVQGVAVATAGLPAALDAAVAKAGGEPRLYLQADRQTDYAQLMQAMDTLRAAGYSRVALLAVEPTAP